MKSPITTPSRKPDEAETQDALCGDTFENSASDKKWIQRKFGTCIVFWKSSLYVRLLDKQYSLSNFYRHSNRYSNIYFNII